MVCFPSSSLSASPSSRPCMQFQYWLAAIGMFDMVKYLFSSSKVAEQPPRLAQTTLAPTFIVLSKDVLKNSLSRVAISVAFAEAKYTGLATTIPSASSNFGASSFTTSSKTHLPSSTQRLQAMHPLTSLLPTCTISASTPSTSNTFFISSNAINVFPFVLGLPLSINTFIMYLPLFVIFLLIQKLLIILDFIKNVFLIYFHL